MESPFDVLGIDPDADDAEVVEAYRRRVLETHPDHGGAAHEFRAVLAAYERIRAGDDGDERGTERERVGAHQRADTKGVHVEYLNYEVLGDHGWDLHDDRLFERAAATGFDVVDHGRFRVGPRDSLLEAAENCGLAWPYACRGGACANCAVAVIEGEMTQPVDHILPPEMVERDIRLSCNGVPTTGEMKVVYNVKHLPDLDELRLPPHPFKLAHPDD